ncbi:MAG: hypothetical protein U0270_15075 [Labilithrix sp.]
MSYRTKRPRLRSILTFGVGATLAITQLGAGCVPPGRYRRCTAPDGAVIEDGGECVESPGTGADGGVRDGGGGDAK